MTPNERRQKVAELEGVRRLKVETLEIEILSLQKELRTLRTECQHVIVETPTGGAKCDICGYRMMGWYCPDSPNHECDYTDPEDPDRCNPDSCRYCGQPDERK